MKRLAQLFSRVPLPLVPMMIVFVSIVFCAAFSRIGTAVGADFGTDGYKEIAEHIVSGDGFMYAPGMPSSMMLGYMKREPLYPLWLAGILLLTGALSPAILCAFQTCLSLISCVLLYRLGKSTFDARTGRLASVIYAVHPISAWYSTRFASEVLAVPLMLLALLRAVNFFAAPTRSKAALLGASIGCAVLTKSACVVLLPTFILFAFFKWRTSPRRLISHIGIMIAVYGTIHSIWIVRNYVLSGEIVPFTTMAGPQFFVGNETLARFDVRRHTSSDEPDHVTDALYGAVQHEIAAGTPGISLPRLEAQTDMNLRAKARQLVLERPTFVVRKLTAGLYFIWFLSTNQAKSLGWMIFQVPLVVCAIIGLSRKQHVTFSQRFLVTVVASYVVPYALLLALARYSMPIIPIVFLFASDAILRFTGRYVRAPASAVLT